MTEDEMIGWHHPLNGHGFGWTPGVGDGQGGLACCNSWGHKELDITVRLNNNNFAYIVIFYCDLNLCISVDSKWLSTFSY